MIKATFFTIRQNRTIGYENFGLPLNPKANGVKDSSKHIIFLKINTVTNFLAWNFSGQNRVDVCYRKYLVWELSLQRHFGKATFH